MIADLQPIAPVVDTSPIKRRPSRRIQPEDEDFIAESCARGLTEASAVALLNKFTINVWAHHKARGRNSRRISHLFARTSAARQNNLIAQISDVADIDRAKTRGVRHDWRAAQMLAGLHDDRFRSQQNSTQINNTTHNQLVIASGGEDGLKKLISQFAACAKEVKVIDVGPVKSQSDQPGEGQKALPDSTGVDKTTPSNE